MDFFLTKQYLFKLLALYLTVPVGLQYWQVWTTANARKQTLEGIKKCVCVWFSSPVTLLWLVSGWFNGGMLRMLSTETFIGQLGFHGLLIFC